MGCFKIEEIRDKDNETGLKEGGVIEMSIYSAFHIRDARSLSLKILTFCITTMVETVAETEQTHLFMFDDGQFRLIHCFTVVQQSSIQCLTSFTNFSILEKIIKK